ncbi:unnamed protein product [Arctia plantaginis]|uniref:DDE Tnp4 domain-containing protein n=1 Tax=Arctia plantaginis TaxID=874455 RepID=A0A8S0Z215_ARCPL|nr:unnamed protein product [Arctia plantaginis]
MLKTSCIISEAVISEAVIFTCRAMIYVLRDYIKMPTNTEDWIDIANEFRSLYNFPRWIGCLDGKHIEVTKPEDSGPSYYNYKGYYSIVLMALVNARKEFIMIDVGTNGRTSDGVVLFYTKFWELYEQCKLKLPEPYNDKDTLGNIEACLNRNASSDAKAVRDQFRQYFIDTARLQNVRNAERQANGTMLVSKLI